MKPLVLPGIEPGIPCRTTSSLAIIPTGGQISVSISVCLHIYIYTRVGRDSSVSIATRYGLGGQISVYINVCLRIVYILMFVYIGVHIYVFILHMYT
jgi:hypothetical protein